MKNRNNMKKIAFILCFLCTILFMVYILFGFFRYVNFRVDSAGMQKLSLVGENDANMYLLTLKLTHCNKQLYFGCMPYPGGISDSVIQIKGYDEKGKTLDEKVLCFPKSQDDSIRTIWLNYENKEVPCNYSLNIDKLQKELNSMTQNIRGEYYSKEEDAHYMYRLFCVPKGQPLPKKLIFRFDKYSIECDVNNIPKRVKVTRIDKMEP